MMREVARPNVGLCLDVPLFKERQSDEYITEAARACGKHVLLTHFGAWNFLQRPDGKVVQDAAPGVGGEINYARYLAGLEEAGYDGYLVGEYCLPCVKDHRLAGIERSTAPRPWPWPT